MKLKPGYKMLNYKNTYTLPFKFSIPSFIDHFISKESNLKTKIKYLKRFIFILLKNQKSLEVFRITDAHQKILWINYSAPSLGDSLMDLSSRVLLKERKVDLLTDKKNVHLYSHDKYFSSIFENINDLKNNNYDLVIIDSFSTKSIKIKSKIAPYSSFVGMYGYFNGPEVNRVLFSFHRMNYLLGSSMTEIEINSIAKCSLTISEYDNSVVSELKLPNEFISIVIGGEWDFRSYEYWINVIKELFRLDKNLNIILLGSQNGKSYVKTILESFSSGNIISYVGKLTFNQSAEIIRQSKLLICCDGGLMHAANAMASPTLVLLARLDEKMQLTLSCKATSLYDSSNVNNIRVKHVIEKYKELTNFFDNRLHNE